MTFVEKSVEIFNQYYPMVFERTKTKTLIIPTSNDLVDNYFYGKIDPTDHPSIYDPEQIKKDKDEKTDRYIKLFKEGSRLLNEAENIVDKSKKEQMQQDGNQYIEQAKVLTAEFEQSDQPWNKLVNIRRNREKESIAKLTDAFRTSDIGGILILSPKMNNLLKSCIQRKYGDLHRCAEKLFNIFKNGDEICDFIYFHPNLGIYLIEVKAKNKLYPITIEERANQSKKQHAHLPKTVENNIAKENEKIKLATSEIQRQTNIIKKERKNRNENDNNANRNIETAKQVKDAAKMSREEAQNKIDIIKKVNDIIDKVVEGENEENEYEKAIVQLNRNLKSNKEELKGSSILQILYFLVTDSKEFPQINGIACFPNAKLSETMIGRLEKEYRHLDSDILSSKDKFKQFWINEVSNCKTEVLFDLFHYHKFIATMANCSVGRELFGINNSLLIAKKISEQNIDPTMMEKREYISSERSQTIFLNEKQLEILNDTSKCKFVFGPPGTGKTILVILAAMDTANKKKSGKVVVLRSSHLVNYMKNAFKMNGFDGNAIEVDNIDSLDIHIYRSDYLFIDEHQYNLMSISGLLVLTSIRKDLRLFIAISGKLSSDNLCLVHDDLKLLSEQFKEQHNAEIDYRLFHLTEILRGTKSIIEFWMNSLKGVIWMNSLKGIKPKRLEMECGHSIIGENVDYCRYLTSGEIMEKMVKKLKELIIETEPKKIAIIYIVHDEKVVIENKLKEEQITFGSVIEQDNAETLIAVEWTRDVFSREWPFVIVITFDPYSTDNVRIIASSRAIAHLTFIERNENEIRKKIRDKCDEKELKMKNILSTFAEYNRFRDEIPSISDDSNIVYNDFLNEIIANNYFPQQIKQLFPIFSDCNTFDEYLEKIVTSEQWMLLLIVHRSHYFNNCLNMPNELIPSEITFEYKPASRYLSAICENNENRRERLLRIMENAIDLLNRYGFRKVKKRIEKTIDENKHLFENLLNKTNGKNQLNMIADSINRLVNLNSVSVADFPTKFYPAEIDKMIADLLQYLYFINAQNFLDNPKFLDDPLD